jgi:hypothetical protein
LADHHPAVRSFNEQLAHTRHSEAGRNQDLRPAKLSFITLGTKTMKLQKPFFAACAATLCIGGIAVAQQQDSQSQDSQSSASRQRSQQQDQAEYRVSPRGWIRIAVDTDNDGTFDAVETIFTYDLERARQSSRDRAKRDAQRAQDQPSADDQRSESRQGVDDDRQRRGMQSNDMPSRRQAKRLSGELVSMRTTKFRGHDGQFVVARIRDENGKTSTVNLGSKSKIDQLNLSQGDEVQLVGRPTRINDKPALVADKVMADGKSVDVSPPKQTASRDSSREGGDSDQSRKDQSRKSGSESSSEPQAALGIAIGEGDQGVVVLGLHPDSPATDKGLQAGDEIISFNDSPVDSPEGLVERIRELTPGGNVRLKIRRDGDEQTMQIKLARRSKLMESLR